MAVRIAEIGHPLAPVAVRWWLDFVGAGGAEARRRLVDVVGVDAELELAAFVFATTLGNRDPERVETQERERRFALVGPRIRRVEAERFRIERDRMRDVVDVQNWERLAEGRHELCVTKLEPNRHRRVRRAPVSSVERGGGWVNPPQ